MARKTIYMGPRLKRMRQQLGLTQADMAADLELSPSYIALMERNQRPVTADTLLKLAGTYGVDIADLARDDGEETSAQLQAALKDPIFADIDLPPIDIEDIAVNYPEFAAGMLRLHTAFREEQMALAELRIGHGTAQSGRAGLKDPIAEARGFLTARRNYFASLDESATAQAGELPDLAAMEAYLKAHHQLVVRYEDAALLRGATRWHDYHRQRISIAEELSYSGRRFQLAMQIALLEQGPAIEQLVEEGRFSSPETAQLVRRALQSYWAAALLMPYDAFARAAIKTRYDIELLAARFSVSFEQAAHRLTTLQRPGLEGVPFLFLRIDQAGNVSKRLDGAGLALARQGGSCPLWNVHQTFERPAQILPQLLTLPDGETYFSISRTVKAGGGRHGSPSAMRAIALACSAEHLEKIAYGDGFKDAEPSAIGVSCRICHRPKCLARSASPIGREMAQNRFRDTGIPFALSGE